VFFAGDYAMDQIVDYRTVLLHNVWCSAGFLGKFADYVCSIYQELIVRVDLRRDQYSHVVHELEVQQREHRFYQCRRTFSLDM